MVGVEHLASMRGVEMLLGPLRPGNRQQPVKIRANHRGLGVRVSHSLQSAQLAFRLLTHRLRHARVRNLLAVFVHDRAVVLAKFLANRVHLTAQEIFALLLLGAVFDVVSNALSHLQLIQPLSLKLNRQPEPLDDVERFKELQLLTEAQVGRVARRIGQGARIGDGPHECADPSVVASQLENLVDNRAILTFQLARETGSWRLVGTGLEIHSKHAVLVARRSAGDRAMEGHERDREPAARESHALGYLRHNADARVCVLLSRHQEHAIVAADVDRQGDRHAREHYRVIQGNDSQPFHSATRIVGDT